MTDVDVLLVNYLTADLAIDALDAVSGPDVSLHVWDNSGELLARSPSYARCATMRRTTSSISRMRSRSIGV